LSGIAENTLVPISRGGASRYIILSSLPIVSNDRQDK
jgi:hypothetical protein